jgi:cell division protein ZapA
MAALNITHELLTTRKRGGFDMEEFKRRIVHMQVALDAVMPEQDKLF